MNGALTAPREHNLSSPWRNARRGRPFSKRARGLDRCDRGRSAGDTGHYGCYRGVAFLGIMRPMVNPQGRGMAFGKAHGCNNLGQIDGGRRGVGVKGPGSSRQLWAARTAIGINPLVVLKDKAPSRFKTFWERRPWTRAIFSGSQAAGACKDAGRDLRSAPPIACRPSFACREASPYHPGKTTRRGNSCNNGDGPWVSCRRKGACRSFDTD